MEKCDSNISIIGLNALTYANPVTDNNPAAIWNGGCMNSNLFNREDKSLKYETISGISTLESCNAECQK